MKRLFIYFLLLSLFSCSSHRATQTKTNDDIPKDVQIVFFSSLLKRHCSSESKDCAVVFNSLPVRNDVFSILQSQFPKIKNANKNPWATNDIGFPFLGSVVYLKGPAKILGADQVEVSGGLFSGWTGGYECQFVLTRINGEWHMPSEDSPMPCEIS
jgi:hypothetical protein